MCKRTSGARFLGVLAGLGALATTASAAVIYDSGGFESPTFATGTLKNQSGWTIYQSGTGTATDASVAVQTANVHGGSQAVQLKNTDGGRVIARRLQTITTNHWVDFWFYPAATTEYTTNPAFNLRAGNTIHVSINTGAAGTINPAPAGPDNYYSFGQWNRLTIFVNLDQDNFDVYVNNKLIGTALSFSNDPVGNDVTAITQYDMADFTSKAGSTGNGVFFDDFRILDSNPIPEPATVLGLEVLGGAALLRRRRAKSV